MVCSLVSSAFGRLRKEESEFGTSLGYLARLHQERKRRSGRGDVDRKKRTDFLGSHLFLIPQMLAVNQGVEGSGESLHLCPILLIWTLLFSEGHPDGIQGIAPVGRLMWPPRESGERSPVIASLEACAAPACLPAGPRQEEISKMLPTVLLSAEEENRDLEKTKFPREAVPWPQSHSPRPKVSRYRHSGPQILGFAFS